MATEPCPDANALLDYSEGRAASSARTAIGNHLEGCVDCQLQIALADEIGATQPAAHPAAAPPLRSQRLWLLEDGSSVEHFRIVRPIARGGMGEVYLARDTRLGRKVALKILRFNGPESLSARERFLNEARATARFSHPHIVSIHAVGEHEGSPFIALEYLEGGTLRERSTRTTLEIGEIVRIGRAVAEALAEAHRHNLLHRDLKPENIVIPKDGRLRVVDFGLAKEVTDARSVMDAPTFSDRLRSNSDSGAGEVETRVGLVLGSPRYMAPEQWRAHQSPATDVWALGIVLHELLFGEVPYPTRDKVKLAIDVTSDAPVPRLTTVRGPKKLVTLIYRCLEKEPAQRPSAEDVAREMERLVPKQSVVDDAAPFLGLFPFSERHAAFFAGREAETAAFVERLRHEPLVTIVGPSGAGKSSFVRAGIVPRLREQGPVVLIAMRPGNRPFRTLASRILAMRSAANPFTPSNHPLDAAAPTDDALTTPPGSVDNLARRLFDAPGVAALVLQEVADRHDATVVLFVDQLEELLLLEDDLERSRFVEALSGAADDRESPVRTIVTLRDEFLSAVSDQTALPDPLGHVAILRQPDAPELRSMLTRPVERVGYRYDSTALVEEMVAEVIGERSCLPLLQFVGQTLWARRDPEAKRLLEAEYRAMGGIAGALARHADGILSGLSNHEQSIARTVLLRLVTPAKTRRVLRRAVLLDGLPEQGAHVVDRLVDERLITVRRSDNNDEPELELVHESLIGAWHRLAQWIDESQKGHAFIERLERGAAAWRNGGERAEDLWTGPQLGHAEGAVERYPSDVSSVARRFVEAARQELVRREVRRRRRVMLVVAASALITIVSLGVAAVIRRAEEVARRERTEAIVERAAAEVAGARSAFLQGDVLDARALLRSALEANDTTAARVLWWQLKNTPAQWRRSVDATVFDAAWTTDANRIVVASASAGLYIVDRHTSNVVDVLRHHSDQVLTVDVAPNSDIASGSIDGDVMMRHRDGTTTTVATAAGPVNSVTFDPTGAKLAFATRNGRVSIHDLSSGRTREIGQHRGAVNSVAFGPKGRWLASASADDTVRIWDGQKNKLVRTIRFRGTIPTGVAFDDAGERLAVAGLRGVELFETKQWTSKARHGRGLVIRSVDWSVDGRVLAGAASDGSIWLWSKERTRRLDKHESSVYAVAFAPDGASIVSGGLDRTLRLWSTDVPVDVAGHDDGHSAAVVGLDFDADGHRLATAGGDGSVRVWSTQTGRVVEGPFVHDTLVRSVAFSPTGKLLSGAADGKIRIWSRETGEVEEVLLGHRGEVTNLRIARDGRVGSTGRDRTARIWSVVEDGRSPRVLRGHRGTVFDLDFLDDGRIATASADATLRLWHPKKRTVVLRGHTSEVMSVREGVDGALHSAGSDGTLRTWVGKRSSVVERTPDRLHWIDEHDGRIAVPASSGLTRIHGTDPASFRGHRSEVNAARFSPDGRRLATTSDDGTVRLWDARTGRPMWNAPYLDRVRGALYSHRGWQSIGPTNERSTSKWQEAIENDAAFGVDDARRTLCVLTNDSKLQRWDMVRDVVVGEHTSASRPLIARGHQCVWVQDRDAFVLTTSARRIATNVDAIGNAPSGLLIATPDRIVLFDTETSSRALYSIDGGVTALAMNEQWLVIGHREGTLLRVGVVDGAAKIRLEDVPSSPVEQIVFGPQGTVFAGFTNGLVGAWDVERGRRLTVSRLHGPVVHLAFFGGRLYAASELGDALAWDLGVLSENRCAVLADVWAHVPVRLRDGTIVREAAPTDHPCRMNAAEPRHNKINRSVETDR